MKLLFTTAGVLAVGAMGIHDAQAQSKPWSVSATLRGFYDSNYATAPSNPPPGSPPAQHSFGIDFSPSASYSLAADQSSLALKYTYGLRYYEDRVNSADHSHQADVLLKHEFSPRCKISADESFVIAQEAALLDPSVSAVTPLRSNGNNIRNAASVTLENEWTRLLGTEFAYSNTFYDYEQTGVGSRSALLDRVEHLIRADLRWSALQTTTVIFGYQFGITDQTSKDLLFAAGPAPDSRDRRSHYAYVGADHYMTEQLSFHPRVGVQYTEYPNALPGVPDSQTSPYADFSVSYKYAEDCSAQLGVKHNRTQTDVTLGTLDAETTAVYGSINHQFTAKISGSVIAQYQRSEFNGGAAGAANQTDQLGLLGVNVAYAINEFLTAEAGYNYDRLSSDIPNRSFTRNRAYVGIRATY